MVKRLSFGEPVRITGGRGARISLITFTEAAGFVLEGITVTPPDNSTHALVDITKDSRDLTIANVLVDGRNENAGAIIDTSTTTSNVTIRDSELTNCGRGKKCVNPNAANLKLLNNDFHDCLSCSFVKGFTGGATITGNTFDRAVPGECRGKGCPHNDLIAIFGGGPWTIVGNRFGTIDLAAGQIYVQPAVEGPIHDVTIASNLFADAGVGVRVGVGSRSRFPPPVDVEIVNNTMLDIRNTGVYLSVPWSDIPDAKRPLVANNVFSMQRPPHCPRARFVSNLAEGGASCPGIQNGPANLDRDGRPTGKSTLVIDRADPRHAPPTDHDGRSRVGPPDRGAFEYRG